jgi:hypothetical protein
MAVHARPSGAGPTPCWMSPRPSATKSATPRHQAATVAGGEALINVKQLRNATFRASGPICTPEHPGVQCARSLNADARPVGPSPSGHPHKSAPLIPTGEQAGWEGET